MNRMFVGQWAAPFLLLGIYNKLVKQHGSDGRSRGRDAGYIDSSTERSHRSPVGTYTQSVGNLNPANPATAFLFVAEIKQAGDQRSPA